MRYRTWWSGLVAFALAGCGQGDDLFNDVEWTKIRTLRGTPVPPDPSNRFTTSEVDAATQAAAFELGEALFFDTGYAAAPAGSPLPAGSPTGCVTCHDPARQFASPTIMTKRAVPTLIDAHGYDWYGWAGKADSEWGFIADVLTTPSVFGSNACDFANRVRTGYADWYGKVGSPVADSDAQVVATGAKAISVYLRTLNTVDGPSALDRYIDGDPSALSPSAKRGLRLFIGGAGCVACHSGPQLSDNAFHNIGPWCDSADLGAGRPAELKAFNETFTTWGAYSDQPDGVGAKRHGQYVAAQGAIDQEKGQYRTRSLRNVALDGPYFHDRSSTSLSAVLAHYDWPSAACVGTLDPLVQPLGLSDEDQADLIELLGSLTGTVGAGAQPELTDAGPPPRCDLRGDAN
jgi:cytochrome c peroxidase